MHYYFFILFLLNILPATLQTIISLKELQAMRKPVFRPNSAPKSHGNNYHENYSGSMNVAQLADLGTLQNSNNWKLAPAIGTDLGLIPINEPNFHESAGILTNPFVVYRDVVNSRLAQKPNFDEETPGDLPDMKYIAHSWGLNLTASRGKKPNCNCGHRRLEGAVPGKEIEWRRQWRNRGANIPETQKYVSTSEAIPNEFPWRVGLQGGPNGVFCGGSIIDNGWILTAARCLANLDQSTVFYVNAGDHDVTTVTETDNAVIRTSHWVIHPKYNATTFDNDIALVRLTRELQYRANIQPICLPHKITDDDLYGVSVVAAGWNESSENSNASFILLKKDLPVHTVGPDFDPDAGETLSANVFSTKVPDGQDGCEGDWGSTVDLYDPDTGRYHAVGITSHGTTCGGIRQPRLYTKIFKYLEFIQNTTRSNFCIK